MEWQEIQIEGIGRAKRRATPSGWMVARLDGPTPGEITLVRDPQHAWDGGLIELR